MFVKKTYKERNLYEIWKSMKQRCSNPKNKDYPNYGGKGVSVCSEWLRSFVFFQKWALESGYSKGLSIDRTNNNGNYCPENCRWVDWFVQANNRSNNHYIEVQGKKTTIAQLSRKTGMSYSTVRTRVNLGWSMERIISEAPHRGKNQFSRSNAI